MSQVRTSEKRKNYWGKFLTIFVLLIASLFTFSACKIFNNNVETNSTYDENGKLRISAPVVTFNAYSTSKANPDERKIDDNSGSFTWDLLYYLDKGSDSELGNIEYDQLYYLSNFYTSASMKPEEVFNYRDGYNKKPILSNNRDEILNYYSGLPRDTEIVGFDSSTAHYYAVEIPDVGKTRIRRVYSGFELIFNQFTRDNKSIINYPDFEVVVDGRYYSFKVVVDYSKLALKSTLDLTTTSNPFVDMSDGSLFKFYYKVGKTNSSSTTSGVGADYKECPAGYMTYFTDENGMFKIRFNPRLEQGTNNRYLKVKNLPKSDGRGSSVFSGVVSFNAYTMTFASYSANSIDTDYGGITFDDGKYYFFKQNKEFDESVGEFYSQVTGAFPEGRKIVISRSTQFNQTYNYALQQWTTNTPAENNVYIDSTMPMGLENQKYSGFIPGLAYENREATEKSCIPVASKKDGINYNTITFHNYREDEINDSHDKITHYLSPTTTNNPLEQYVYEACYKTDNGTNGDLVVVSHARLSGYKFYANFTKVRNFKITGTFFAGDNFFTGANQYLEFVDITVFSENDKRNPIGALTGFDDEITIEMVDANGSRTRSQDIKIERSGAYFSVTGLEYGDYLYFEKISDPVRPDEFLDSTQDYRLPFNFYSNLMEERDVFETLHKKVMTLKINATLFSDRQDIGIIGTQFNEDTNLVVKIYRYNASGDNAELVGTDQSLSSLDGLSYEIIKTVSSYEDEDGYITTNVILSVMLPSNQILTGYNVETINNTTNTYFKGSDGNVYVSRMEYDPQNKNVTSKYFFMVSSVEEGISASEVKLTQSGTTITFRDAIYVYTHNTRVKDNDDQTSLVSYFIKLDDRTKDPTSSESSYSILARIDDGTYNLITYVPVVDCTFENILTTSEVDDGFGGEKTIKTYMVKLKTGNSEIILTRYSDNLNYNDNYSDMSAIASAYRTEMKQTVHDETNGINDTNDVYVYYDVVKIGDYYYYTAPIARSTLIADENGGYLEDIAIFFKEISNFDSLKGSSIKLGKDITDEAFKRAVGAGIVSSCYYYVAPVGNSIGNGTVSEKIYVKQFAGYDKDYQKEQLQNEFYYFVVDRTTNKIRRISVKDQNFATTSVKSLFKSKISFFDNSQLEIEGNINGKVLYNGKIVFTSKDARFNVGDPNSYETNYTTIQRDETTNGANESGIAYAKEIYYNHHFKSSANGGPNGGPDYWIRTEYELHFINNGNEDVVKLFYDKDNGGKFYRIINTLEENVYLLSTSTPDDRLNYSFSSYVYTSDGNENSPRIGINADGVMGYYNEEGEFIASEGALVVVGREKHIQYLSSSYYLLEFGSNFVVNKLTKVDATTGATEEISTNSINEYTSTETGVKQQKNTYNLVYLIPYYYMIVNSEIENSDDPNITFSTKKLDSNVRDTQALQMAFNDGKIISSIDVNFAAVSNYYVSFNTVFENNALKYVINSQKIDAIETTERKSIKRDGKDYFIAPLKDPNGNLVVTPMFSGDGNMNDNKYTVYVVYNENECYLINNYAGSTDNLSDAVWSSRIRVDFSNIIQLFTTEEYIYQTTRQSSIYRIANIVDSGRSITLLGKYIQSKDGDPIVYPSFSNLNVYTEEDFASGSSTITSIFQIKDGAYSLDYTSLNIVIEGFPGVSLLAGPPYPNPILYFSVRHKANEDAYLNVALDIKSAYYVEVLGSHLENGDELRDFTTYSFKDTYVNMQLNRYIDKVYWVLDKDFMPIKPYKKVGNEYIEYAEGYNELSLRDVALNDGDTDLYFNDVVGANGKYLNKVYRQVINANGKIDYQPINYNTDVVLWETNSTKLENVQIFDIHSYYQGLDGTLNFHSGSYYDANQVCIGLDGIEPGLTTNPNSVLNYDEVIVSGVVNAYRTTAKNADNGDGDVGYWLEHGVHAVNAFNSTDPFFMTGKNGEGVVLIASPTVSFNKDSDQNYIYRFKEWRVYSRDNSEILYYDNKINSTIEKNKAILRFTSDEAGYFVFLPVYERILSIDIGTAVVDGPINQGGGVDVFYDKDSAELDVDGIVSKDLFTYDYYQTMVGSREGYFYGDISARTFLYFTGEFREVEGLEEGRSLRYPVFEVVDNIFVYKVNNKRDIYFKLLLDKNNNVKGFVPYQVIDALQEGKQGLVMVQNAGGTLNGNYNNEYTLLTRLVYEENKNWRDYKETPTFDVNTYLTSLPMILKVGDTYLSNTTEVRLGDMFSYAFTSTFYPDTINSTNPKQVLQSCPLFLDSDNNFRVIDLNKIDYSKLEKLPYANKYHSTRQYLTSLSDYLQGGLFSAPEFGTIEEMIDAFNKYENNPSITLSLNSILGDTIAKLKINQFISTPTIWGTVRTDGLVQSSKGIKQYSDELMYDEDGNLYATQQFKSTYIDRDAYVELRAKPKSGYRVEGWYLCVYDYATKSWRTTDEKVPAETYAYDDEIHQVHYNSYEDCYYYVTDFMCVYNKGTENESIVFYYNYDEVTDVYSNEAIVPDAMLSTVRGTFINKGTTANPNWVQIYRRGIVGNDYYYDRSYTQPVTNFDTYSDSMKELPYYAMEGEEDAIKREDQRFYLNNIEIFQTVEVDDYNQITTRFYRVRTLGNVTYEGNILTIQKLHANVRYVAKFIEVYNEYIYTEDSENSGVEIKAVFYNSTDPRKIGNEIPAIRTNEFGVNMTEDDISFTHRKDGTTNDIPEFETDENGKNTFKDLFKLYDQTKTPEKEDRITDNNYLSSDFTMVDPQNSSKTITAPKYKSRGGLSAQSVFNFMQNGFSSTNSNNMFATTNGITPQVYTDTYMVNKENLLNQSLAMKSLYFDADTIVYIVVSVKANYSLNVHSLGMNSRFEIEPILEPDARYVEYNNAASPDDKVDFLYYVFRVAYNRDPENENVNYITHPQRSTSMVFDVVEGNYLHYYSSYVSNSKDKKFTWPQISLGNNYAHALDSEFNIKNNSSFTYDEKTDKFTYKLKQGDLAQYFNYKAKNGKQFLKFKDDGNSLLLELYKNNLISLDTYILLTAKDDSGNTYPQSKHYILDKEFSNFKDALDEICYVMINPGALYLEYVYYEPNKELVKDTNLILNYIDGFVDGLASDGNENFVNLSSNPIYIYTLQTITADDYDTPLTYDDNGRVVLNNNTTTAQHVLANGLWTYGGMNGDTYLGVSESVEDGEYNYYSEHGSSIYDNETIFTFNKHFTIDPGKTGIGTTDMPEGTIMADLPFMQNSVVLFDGVGYKNGDNFIAGAREGYAFVGWYEQKYDRENEVWSPLTLMSTSLEKPYQSLAVADTVVVALFKRVIDVKITYDKAQMNVIMAGGGIDSTGNKLTKTGIDGTTLVELSGKFFFDSEVKMTIIPVGGFRFDAINYSFGAADTYAEGMVDLYASDINYYDKYGNNMLADGSRRYEYDDMLLNGIFSIGLPLKHSVFDTNNSYLDIENKDTSLLNLNIVAKKIQLVYVDIDGYYYSENTFSGFDFGLYYFNGNSGNMLLRTHGADGIDNYEYYSKDSTHSYVNFYLSGGHLYIYGYFDYEASSSLVLGTFTDIDVPVAIKQWKINGDEDDQTSLMPELNTEHFTKSNYRDLYNEFEIKFNYEDELAYLNEADRFALSPENDIYYIYADIDSAATVTINHKFIDDVGDFGTTGKAFGEDNDIDANSLVTFVGIYYHDDIIEQNSSFIATNSNTYRFNKRSVLSATVEKKYITFESGGENYLYVFLGWFEKNMLSSGVNQPYSQIITTNLTLKKVGVNSTYEAVYVRAYRTEINSNENGSLSFLNTYPIPSNRYSNSLDGVTIYDYYQDGGYYYTMGGANLQVSAIADQGYSIPVLNFTDKNGDEIRSSDTIFQSTTEAVRTAIKVSCDFTINAVFTLGIQLVINQLLYNSLEMNDDPMYINGISYIYIEYNGRQLTALNNVYPEGSDLILRYNVDAGCPYYFVGFYINGKIMTIDELGLYLTEYQTKITEDLVIEARYVPLISLSAISRIANTSSQISPFSADISFVDLRTQKTNTIHFSSGTGTRISIPAGLVVNVSETRSETSEGYPYTFIGWAYQQPDSNFNFMTYEKELNIALTSLHTYAENMANFVAIYAQTTFISVHKTIGDVSEEDQARYYKDGEPSEQFLSFFDLTITYTDIFDNEQSVSLGELTDLSLIPAKRNTLVKVTITINGIVSDRYYLSELYHISPSVRVDILKNNTYYYEIGGGNSIQNINIFARFDCAKFITISNELNGITSSEQLVGTEYEILDSEDRVVSSGVIHEETSLPIKLSQKIRISPVYDESIMFLGFYLNGVRNEVEELTIEELENAFVISKFISAANFTITREVDGVKDTAATDLDVYFAGTFLNSDNIFEVQRHEIGDDAGSVTGLIMQVSENKLVLSASSIVGYRFMGFKIYIDGFEYTPDVVEDTYSTVATAVFTYGTEIEVVASFEKEYIISYTTITINGEDKVENTKGGSISGQPRSYTELDTNFEFTLHINEGYALEGVYVYDESGALIFSNIDYTNGSIVSINTPATKGAVNVEIRFVQLLNLTIHVAVEGTEDASQIRNLLGVDINLFSYSLGDYSNVAITEDNTSGAIKTTITGFGVGSGSLGGDLLIKHNGNDYIEGRDARYTFAGWFVYDGFNVASSNYPLSYSNALSIVLNGNVDIVAKFAREDTNTQKVVQTQYSFEFFDGKNIEKTTEFSGSVDPKNNYTTYNGETYLFIGYYAPISTGAMNYLLLKTEFGSATEFDGKYPNVVARFVKVVDINFNFTTDRVVSASSEVVTKYYLVDKISSGENLQAAVNSDISIVLKTVDGFNFNNIDIEQETIEQTNIVEDFIQSIEVAKTNFEVVSSHNDGKIGEVSVTKVKADALTFTITETTLKSTLTLEITENILSSMYVSVINPDGTKTDYTLNNENQKEVINDVLSGTYISLWFKLSNNEEFLGYKLTQGATNDFITTVTYSLYFNGEALTILGSFRNTYGVTILENDIEKGTANVVEHYDTNEKTLSITANNTYEVFRVLVSEVKNGKEIAAEEYDLIENVPDSLFASYTFSHIFAETDRNGQNYIMTFQMKFLLKADIVVRIEYSHVAKIYVELFEANTIQDDVLIYFFESDGSILNLARVKAVIDANEELSEVLRYTPSELCYFTYNGETLSDDTSLEIDITKQAIVHFRLNRSSYVDIKVIVDPIFKTVSGDYSTSHDVSATIYKSPVDGLKVYFDEKLISTAKSFGVINDFISNCSLPLIASDDSNYFEFDGFYTDIYEAANSELLETSSAFTISAGTISKLLTDGDGTTKVIHAVFKERTEVITIKTEVYSQPTYKITYGDQTMDITDAALTVREKKVANMTIDQGDFTAIMQKLGGELVLTIEYSLALVNDHQEIRVTASDFSIKNTDDPLLKAIGVETFYEKEEGENYYRFDCFITESGKHVHEDYKDYDSTVTIDFGDYIGGDTIIARAIQLYVIEFAYDYFSDKFSIKLELTRIGYDELGQICVQSVLINEIDGNNPNIKESIITYRAELGQTVTATVVIKEYDEEFPFSSIIASKTKMASELFSEADKQIIGEGKLINNKDDARLKNPPYSEEESPIKLWWENEVYMNTETNQYYYSLGASIFDFNEKLDGEDDLEYGKITRINFSAEENVSLIADFYGCFTGYRNYVAGGVTNPEYNGSLDLHIADSLKDNAFKGNGFVFDFAKNGENVDVEFHDIDVEYNTNYGDITYTTDIQRQKASALEEAGANPTERGDQTVTHNADGINHTISGVVYDFAGNVNKQLTFRATIMKYYTLTLGAYRMVKNYNTEEKGYDNDSFESLNEKLVGLIEVNGIKSDADGVYIENIKPHDDINYTSTTYTIKAPITDFKGYFFKGFMVVSSAYEASNHVFNFGRKSQITTYNTYYFLATEYVSDGDIYYAQTTFTFSGDIEIYALYEPRVYVVNYSTKQFDDVEDSLISKDKLDAAGGNKVLARMTNDNVVASKYKGCLLVENDRNVSIQTTTFPYFMFVGWATTSAYLDAVPEETNRFKVYLDNEEFGLEYDEVMQNSANAKQLLADNVFVNNSAKYEAQLPLNSNGTIDTGKLTPNTNLNNINIYNIKHNIDLVGYYTHLSYNIKVNLADIIGVLVNDDIYDRTYSSYLAYADYIVENENWKNPSAGSYTFTTVSQSNTENGASTTTTITIDEKDPFVYVMNDKYGTAITLDGENYYPTRVPSALVDFDKFATYDGIQYLQYKYVKKDGKNEQLRVIQPGNKSITLSYPYEFVNNNTTFNAQELAKNLYETHRINDIGFDKFLENNSLQNSSYYKGFTNEHYEVYHELDENNNLISSTPCVKNIYSYLQLSTDENQLHLLENLFKVYIGKNEYDSSCFDLNIDIEKGTIDFDIRMVATDYGFPSVLFTSDDKTFPLMNVIVHAFNAKNYFLSSSSEYNNLKDLSGFYQTLFSGNIDEKTTFENLDVNVVVEFALKPIRVNASVELENARADRGERSDGSNYLTTKAIEKFNLLDYANLEGLKYDAFINTNQWVNENNRGEEISKNIKNTTSKVISDNKYEVQNYYIIVVKNGAYLLDLLQAIIDDNYGSLAKSSVKSSNSELARLKKLAVTLRSSFESTIIGDTDDNGRVINLANTGNIDANVRFNGELNGETITRGGSDKRVNMFEYMDGDSSLVDIINLISSGTVVSIETKLACLLNDYYGLGLAATDKLSWFNFFFSGQYARVNNEKTTQNVRSAFLDVKVIDVLAYADKGIDPAMIGTFINSGDLVLSQCVLPEHIMPEHNLAESWFGGIWSADKGYDYIAEANLTLKYGESTANGQVIESSNNSTVAEHVSEEFMTNRASNGAYAWNEFVNVFRCLFGGRKSYAGTYFRVVHNIAGLPRVKTSSNEITSIDSILTLHLNNPDEHNLPTYLHDWEQVPGSNRMFDLFMKIVVGCVLIVVTLAMPVGAIATVGALLIATGYVIVITASVATPALDIFSNWDPFQFDCP